MNARRPVSCLLVLSLPLLAAACGARSEDSRTVAQWELEELWRVGGEAAGPHSFDANFGLAILPGDTIVHFDHQTQQLFLLDPAGTPIHAIGREGQGPGESMDANGFAVSPTGVIVVNDRGNLRFTRLRTDATLLGTVSLPWKFTRGLRWDATFLADGSLVERYALPTDSGGWHNITRKWDGDLAASQVLGIDSCTRSSAPAGDQRQLPVLRPDDSSIPRISMPVPFSGPWTATAIDPAGYLWSPRAGGPDSVLVRFALDGCDSVTAVALGGEEPMIPELVRDSSLKAQEGFASAMGGHLPEEFEIPTHYPHYQSVFVDRVGRLWVERFAPGGRSRMEVFDTGGQLVARVDDFPLLATRSPVVITTDRIYGFTTDTDGIKYLVALRIHRESE